MQEIGIPSPIPNELVLTFAGYLIYKGIFFGPFVLLLICTADWVGTTLLFFLFYFFSVWVVRLKQRVLPKPYGLLANLNRHVHEGRKTKLFFLRLAPFIRGYTSIAAGMLRLNPVVFIRVVGLSALVWASFYLSIGYFFGPYWAIVEQHIHDVKVVASLVSGVVIAFIGARLAVNYWVERR